MLHAWETALRGHSLSPENGDALSLADSRLAVLVALLQMHDAPLAELVDFALESGVRLTGSASGYVALLEDDEAAGDVYTWSSEREASGNERLRTSARSELTSRVTATARRRLPWTDDPGEQPTRDGVRVGPGAVRRLDVPILDAGRVVSVVGVAGKPVAYDQADVWQLTLLVHGVWRFIRRREGEDRLLAVHQDLERRVQVRTSELEAANSRLRADVEERRVAEEAQRRTEERLRASEARFRTVVESVEDVVFTMDCDQRFVGLFGRRIERWLEHLGTSLDAIVGKRIRDVLGEDAAAHESAFARALAGQHAVYEFSMDLDRRRHFQTSVSPIRNAAGDVSGIVGVGRDITARRALESQLLQAQKLESIGQLAAGIAHEINTPIQFVGDNLRFLADAAGAIRPVLDSCREAGTLGTIPESELAYLLEEVPAAIAQSLDGVERVAGIVRAMKAYSHPDSGLKTAVDINSAIESTVAVARHEWKYVADVQLHLAPEAPRVSCYAGELNQAVLNILVNAAHAIEATHATRGRSKGLISVTTAADGGWVEIRISDTGAGIPAQIRSRVFDPFFTTKEVGKGTGQGLTLAHAAIVGRLGGSLTFETETDRGTTFILRIPVNAA